MVLRNTKCGQLSILFIISTIAVVTAGTVYARTQKPKMIMVPAITIADANISRGEVNVVTSDDSFARVHISQNTSISRNGAIVGVSSGYSGRRFPDIMAACGWFILAYLPPPCQH